MYKNPHAKITTTDEGGNVFYLEYYITKDCTPVNDTIQVWTYGVVVQKHTHFDTESASAPALFTSNQQAIEFVDLMSRNIVTPVTLPDIVEDILAGQIEHTKQIFCLDSQPAAEPVIV